ncbi:MAG: bifunctional precorrin-2 dehydrogenase/sirohydrochlorin ferrochelatase [Desulfuromonadales bacterium]|nr:bifunctional precorrin-2 dehydrogenase/sirohydrochlorin ferrochelatase [Desulfuromonadales bacterium]
MTCLTLSIEIQGRNTLVVGGGAVACRKTKKLLKAGARVYVVTLSLDSEIKKLQQSADFRLRIGPYTPHDLDEIFLVVAASDSIETNAEIAREAQQRGILVAVVNAPKLGNCTFPAVLQRGALEIAVSSGGRCPAFSVLVRDHLATLIGEDFGSALEQLAAEREKLLTEGNCSTYNAKIVRAQAQQLIAALSDTKETV